MKNIETIINNDDMFILKWRLTEWCNYRCSYCLRAEKKMFSNINDMRNKDADEKIVLETAPEVSRILDEIAVPVKINIIGGETTFLNLKSI